jgi:hypothetical protein
LKSEPPALTSMPRQSPGAGVLAPSALVSPPCASSLYEVKTMAVAMVCPSAVMEPTPVAKRAAAGLNFTIVPGWMVSAAVTWIEPFTT